MTLIYVLVVVLALALALWLVSLPKNVPGYTKIWFYISLIVVALIAIFIISS